MTAPIPVRVTRYRCPHCPRSHASRARAVEHIGRCWHNPDARGCKTCAHFQVESDACGCEPGCNWGNSDQSIPEGCAAGVDLTGRPACAACGGHGWADTSEGGERRCTSETSTCHVGDGREVPPGPIVGCPLWVLRPDPDAQAEVSSP